MCKCNGKEFIYLQGRNFTPKNGATFCSRCTMCYSLNEVVYNAGKDNDLRLDRMECVCSTETIRHAGILNGKRTVYTSDCLVPVVVCKNCGHEVFDSLGWHIKINGTEKNAGVETF